MAKLICSVDSEVLAAGKVTLMTMRKSIKMLLDRNLLQGSVHGGFKMHVRTILVFLWDGSYNMFD